MSEFYLIFVWLACMAIMVKRADVYKATVVSGKRVYRIDLGIAVLIFLPLVVMAGFRKLSLFDTGMYAWTYRGVPGSLSGLLRYLPFVEKDKGFTVLSSIIKMIFGRNIRTYLLILAILQGCFLIRVFWRYSTNYIWSVFLFIASTDYISWMFNGIRQFTAVTLIFAATDLKLRKKYVPLIVVILLASTIHGSALLMLPVVFIVQGKAWNQKTILVLLASLIAILFISQFTDILEILLSDTQYTNVVSDWKAWNDDGTNPLRVLVYSVPTFLAFIGRKGIKKADDPVINLSTNMSICSTGLWLVSMVSSGLFIGRLPIYTSLYAFGILLPWELDHLFTVKSTKIVKIMAIGAYLLFYYYQINAIWHIV